MKKVDARERVTYFLIFYLLVLRSTCFQFTYFTRPSKVLSIY